MHDVERCRAEALGQGPGPGRSIGFGTLSWPGSVAAMSPASVTPGRSRAEVHRRRPVVRSTSIVFEAAPTSIVSTGSSLRSSPRQHSMTSRPSGRMRPPRPSGGGARRRFGGPSVIADNGRRRDVAATIPSDQALGVDGRRLVDRVEDGLERRSTVPTGGLMSLTGPRSRFPFTTTDDTSSAPTREAAGHRMARSRLGNRPYERSSTGKSAAA